MPAQAVTSSSLEPWRCGAGIFQGWAKVQIGFMMPAVEAAGGSPKRCVQVRTTEYRPHRKTQRERTCETTKSTRVGLKHAPRRRRGSAADLSSALLPCDARGAGNGKRRAGPKH